MTNKSKPRKTQPARSKTADQKDVTSLNLIGVFVLAAGFAAFVAVLYLGYVKFFSMEHVGPARTVESPGPSATEQSKTAGTQVERSGLDLNKASLGTMQGNWRAKYGAITAVLSLGEAKTFDLVLYMDDIGYKRLVAKGEYSYDDDNGVMRLQPSYDPPPDIEGSDIAPLTYRPYNIIVLRKADDGNILWLPHIKEGHRDQIHPIFVHMGVVDEYIEWSPQGS